MSVPVRTTPSETALAKQNRSPEAQRILDERKQLHLLSAKISEMNWGKGLSPALQNAVAAYCRQNLIDPTEIDVLGGNIYRNARYFLRRLSEMTEDGLIEYGIPDHVHVDKRLVEIAKGADERAAKARAEIARREDVRIQLNIPDAAVAAVVFRVKLANVPVEFAAAKWCGGGTRKNDPVGEAFPVESAETRACRRVMRYIASQIPHLKWREDELEDRAQVITARMVDERAEVRGQQARIPTHTAGFDSGARPTLLTQGDDLYASAGTRAPIATGETVPATVAEPAEPVRTIETPDAYDNAGASPDEPSRVLSDDENLELDRQLLADEAREASPPGSKNVRMPKGGNVQDAFPLGDEPRRRGRDALREG